MSDVEPFPLVIVDTEAGPVVPADALIAYLRSLARQLRAYPETQPDAMILEKVAAQIEEAAS